MEHPRECRQTMIDQNYTGDYDLDYDLQRRSDETVAGFFPVPGSQFCIKSLAWRILLLFPFTEFNLLLQGRCQWRIHFGTPGLPIFEAAEEVGSLSFSPSAQVEVT